MVDALDLMRKRSAYAFAHDIIQSGVEKALQLQPDHITPVFPVFWDHSTERLSLKQNQNIYDEDQTLLECLATVATQASLQPAAPKIFYLYGLWAEDTTAANWAANRDFTPYLTDGTHTMIMSPTETATAGLGTVTQIWPAKEADDILRLVPPVPISNAYYLTVTDTMAAAETGSVWALYVHRSSEI